MTEQVFTQLKVRTFLHVFTYDKDIINQGSYSLQAISNWLIFFVQNRDLKKLHIYTQDIEYLVPNFWCMVAVYILSPSPSWQWYISTWQKECTLFWWVYF